MVRKTWDRRDGLSLADIFCQRLHRDVSMSVKHDLFLAWFSPGAESFFLHLLAAAGQARWPWV